MQQAISISGILVSIIFLFCSPVEWTLMCIHTYVSTDDMSALTILMLSLDGSGSGFFGDLLFLKSRFAGSIALSYYSLVPPKPPR
ncbi:hypothetical protein TWF132_000759 [Orbilia oligospora]|nr:hypothetical protein TWF132_000759 [Orbilia oligospora]